LVKIRLQRLGRRNAPFYRIVVAESRTQTNGKVIEELGYYHPRITVNEKQIQEIEMDKEKYLAWIKKGAKPSDSIQIIAKRIGLS
jgi:small subunit ribosomal protein S16